MNIALTLALSAPTVAAMIRGERQSTNANRWLNVDL
jgi:hypothetical protein